MAAVAAISSSLLVGKSQKLPSILSDGQMSELSVTATSVRDHTNHQGRTDQCHSFYDKRITNSV